jgi:hypothetical protein
MMDLRQPGLVRTPEVMGRSDRRAGIPGEQRAQYFADPEQPGENRSRQQFQVQATLLGHKPLMLLHFKSPQLAGMFYDLGVFNVFHDDSLNDALQHLLTTM